MRMFLKITDVKREPEPEPAPEFFFRFPPLPLGLTLNSIYVDPESNLSLKIYSYNVNTHYLGVHFIDSRLQGDYILEVPTDQHSNTQAPIKLFDKTNTRCVTSKYSTDSDEWNSSTFYIDIIFPVNFNASKLAIRKGIGSGYMTTPRKFSLKGTTTTTDISGYIYSLIIYLMI